VRGACRVVVRLLGDGHSPSGFTLNLSLSLLTAIVIGGLGSLTGAIIGSFILVYLPVWTGGFASSLNLSSNVANNVPLAIYGIVLIRGDPRVPARNRRRDRIHRPRRHSDRAFESQPRCPAGRTESPSQ